MSTKKKSLRQRMQERRDKLAKGGGGNFNFFIFPEGVTRLRHVNVGEDEEPAFEILYVFLSKEKGGFISPATFGEKCAFQRAFEKLSKSKKSEDKEFAYKVRPKRKFASLAYRYKDEAGKEVDYENGVKIALLAKSQYEEMVDMWLDEEQGDFTDPIRGYDLKHKRTGTGRQDTRYKVLACKPTKADKKFRKTYNLEEEIKKLIPSYKETVEMLEEFLNLPPESDDDKDTRKSSKKTSSKNKKRRNSDI